MPIGRVPSHMTEPIKHLRDSLSRYIHANPKLALGELSQRTGLLLREFAEAGTISLGEDQSLTGESLEVRVFLLLQSVGFVVSRGREGFEDFTVQAPSEAKTSRPLVLEVKSDRKPYVQRDQLRQLDDWVFDLSQEGLARKQGLGGGLDSLALATSGLRSRRHFHPSPHKGVLVFNGPIGMPFSERVFSCLSHEEQTFAIKRSFCIFPFGLFVSAISKAKNDDVLINQFWEQIQSTEGEFAS